MPVEIGIEIKQSYISAMLERKPCDDWQGVGGCGKCSAGAARNAGG